MEYSMIMWLVNFEALRFHIKLSFYPRWRERKCKFTFHKYNLNLSWLSDGTWPLFTLSNHDELAVLYAIRVLQVYHRYQATHPMYIIVMCEYHGYSFILNNASLYQDILGVLGGVTNHIHWLLHYQYLGCNPHPYRVVYCSGNKETCILRFMLSNHLNILHHIVQAFLPLSLTHFPPVFHWTNAAV